VLHLVSECGRRSRHRQSVCKLYQPAVLGPDNEPTVVEAAPDRVRGLRFGRTPKSSSIAVEVRPVTNIADNFINWKGDAPPIVVGHITVPAQSAIPPEGTFLQLDVSDAVVAGWRSSMVARMYRFGASPGQPPS